MKVKNLNQALMEENAKLKEENKKLKEDRGKINSAIGDLVIENRRLKAELEWHHGFDTYLTNHGFNLEKDFFGPTVR